MIEDHFKAKSDLDFNLHIAGYLRLKFNYRIIFKVNVGSVKPIGLPLDHGELFLELLILQIYVILFFKSCGPFWF